MYIISFLNTTHLARCFSKLKEKSPWFTPFDKLTAVQHQTDKPNPRAYRKSRHKVFNAQEVSKYRHDAS